MTLLENEQTKLTLSASNFSAGNTPPQLQKIADIVLKLAVVGVIVGGTLAAPPLNLAVGGQIVMYSGVFGTMFKSIAKLFGVTVKE